jgi:inosine-uridine nucleoside N-ribohydrolase
MNTKAPRKVIYDTDPGVDDAMALYFALAHTGIDVVGITTTFGNVSVEQAATNALYLTAIAGKKVPVTVCWTPAVRPNLLWTWPARTLVRSHLWQLAPWVT